MHMQDLPRTVVRTWLYTARLPLTAVESVVRRGERDVEWAPAIAFDSFEATVKQLAGSLLRDDDLVQEGRLEQARVTQLRKAVELDAVAEQRKGEADAEYQQRIRADEERRREVEDEAARRETALDRKRAEAERRVEADAARKRDEAARAQAAVDKAVTRQERAARRTRVTSERDALSSEREAVAAKGRVLDVEEELEATKAARKSGS